MARKDPQDLTKAWPQQPGTREAIEGNADVEFAIVPGAVQQSGEVVFLEHLFNPSALREMLKSNEYQVVLVSPNGQRLSRIGPRTFFQDTGNSPFAFQLVGSGGGSF